MKIRTANSTYEVDADLRVRRLGGDNASTPYLGEDGEWRQAENVAVTPTGCVFIWYYDGFVARTTMTSEVVHVEGWEERVLGMEEPRAL